MTLPFEKSFATRRRRTPPRGSRQCQLDISGVLIECTFDIEGQYMQATELDPAEYPVRNLISATIGGVCVLALRNELGLDNALDEVQL